MTTIDTNALKELCAKLGVGQAVYSCLQSRGLETPGDVAFSIPDPESLAYFIKAVLRDDPALDGNALEQPDLPDAASKIHKEAGKLRRLYAEAKHLSVIAPTPNTTVFGHRPSPRASGTS